MAVSWLSGGVGLLVKSLALSCTQATRCSTLPGALLPLQCSTTRWFSKQQSLEEYPKRPLTSFLLFSLEQRPGLVKQYPEAKLVEISKMLGLEWRGLSESAKMPYVQAANEERLKYYDEVRKYKEKSTPLELEILKDKKRQRMVKRKHIALKRMLTAFGKPKRPRNAYNLFMSQHYHEIKGVSLTERMSILHEQWNRLSRTRNQMYLQLAQDDKIRYENEMKAWEEQMFVVGREDLIRNKARKRLIKDAAVMHNLNDMDKPTKQAVEADKWQNEE